MSQKQTKNLQLLCWQVGNHIDVQTGKWTAEEAGIGPGIDSYFEYLLKGAVLFESSELMEMFEGEWVKNLPLLFVIKNEHFLTVIDNRPK